jgi:membrane-bound lytic murein transglycosylase B
MAPAQIVCAIWGVESTGQRRGDIRPSAISLLVFDRAAVFFEKQLIAAVQPAGRRCPCRVWWVKLALWGN